jgi:alpha-mannosidase
MIRVQNPLPQLIPQRVARTKSQVDALLWERVQPLEVRGGPVNGEPIAVALGHRQPMHLVRPGEHFGPRGGGWHQRWFRVKIPAARRGETGRRFLHWQCQGETTAYLDGKPWAGLDVAHATCPLPDRAATLWLDCSTWQTGIWPPGVSPVLPQVGPYGLRFDGCTLRIRNELAWDTSWDLDVFIQLVNVLLGREGLRNTGPFGYVRPLDSCSPLLRRILRGLQEACDAFVHDGLPALRAALRALARQLPAEVWQPTAALCGHAHLDLVWLWPEMATERKAVHGFATQLRLMERYPEITFVQSQPALYRAVQRRAPSLLREIRKRIRERRWEVMGGFEVEPDTNLPSGEALARSLLYGQDKIAELRGRISEVCWIPDVFGYSTCLPQILRLAGITAFFTTKMTWSQITKFPYTSFIWRGSDGSEVLAHLCPTGYNGLVDVDNLCGAARDHRQADVHPEVLLPTGFGDGGGGLTEAMCERATRLANLAGAPKTRWTTSEAFFRRLARVRDRLPVYQGELYLEYHRGTYTTQSEFKRLYRAAETALQAHEAVRVVTRGKPLDDQAWLRVLFCQFHDAIPGSSIGLVYQQLNPELSAIVQSELRSARTELAELGKQGGYIVFNPVSLARTAIVELPRSPAAKAAAAEPIRQKIGRGRHSRWLALARLPALSGVRLFGNGEVRNPVIVRGRSRIILDNGIVRAEFDRRGQLVTLALSDEPLALTRAAGFILYHDSPANFDAWDIDHYTLAAGQPVATQLRLAVIESGPLRARLQAESPIGERSRLVVDYVLEADSRYLRTEIRVDWHESNRLLKFHIPTAYRGRWARFGCPFGSIQRPQLPGVSADEAMWEVPASRWAAVTDEGGNGLAVLTEAKHGFSCRDGDLGLSLLRSPKVPDANADMGAHSIRFAMGRHEPITTATVTSTAAAADALFAPILLVEKGAVVSPPFELANLGTLAPSWIVPTRRGDGFILRLHETIGAAGVARLHLRRTPRSVDLVDFLERRIGRPPRRRERTFDIPYQPYQVLSVRVRSR